MKVFHIRPETTTGWPIRAPQIFLAGSIEQGKAIDWQSEVVRHFEDQQQAADIVIFNPRRETWFPNIEQSSKNKIFNEQVTFELDHIEIADGVLMYLQPETLSPISLLELGLLAGLNYSQNLNKVVVCCPQGFWRRGNVEMMCERYHIPLLDDLPSALVEFEALVNRNFERRVTFMDSFRL